MPRVLTNEQLLKRGAQVDPLKPKTDDEQVSPLVGAATIDTTPIAEAVNQMSAVVKSVLEEQRPLLEKIVEKQSQPVETKKPPEVWEFKINRDARGRLDTIRATAVG